MTKHALAGTRSSANDDHNAPGAEDFITESVGDLPEQERKAIAGRVGILAGVAPGTIMNLFETAGLTVLPADYVVFREGGRPTHIYMALDGRVGLYGEKHLNGHRHTKRAEGIVEVLDAGEPFLAPAVILDLEYLLTARTLDKTRLLSIPAVVFREVLGQDSALSYAVNLALARHWRMIVTQVRDMKRHTAGERLAAYLLTLAEANGEALSMRLPTTKGMLASKLGMAPESLSRALAELEEVGVASRGRQISIASIKTLRAYCHR